MAHTPEYVILDAEVIVKGKKKARRKYFDHAHVIPLANLRSPLEKSYWNTYHCCEVHLLEGGKLRAQWTLQEGKLVAPYCKNRWCMLCSSIRTAELINRYKPVLDGWEDKFFVTLTIPNVAAEKLKDTIILMQKEFVKIKNKAYRRNQRGTGGKFMGFRKLECTYNNEKDSFHPHYHTIVRGEEAAKGLLEEWLTRFPDAKRIAQDVRPADEDSVKELFKYFTKLTVKIDGKYTVPNPRAQDMMFQAMRGRRVFQNFGFKAPPQEEDEPISEEAEKLAEEIQEEVRRQIFIWVQENHDWVDHETGQLLTGYHPTDGVKEMVKRARERK